MSQLFVAIRAVVYAMGFVSLWGWLALAAWRSDAARHLTLPFWTGVFGVPLLAFGAFVMLACVVSFVVAGKGTPAPFDPPRKFVAVGPYRWVRNPMFLGGAAALVGGGMAFRSPSVLALAAAGLVLAHAYSVFLEEPGLARRFGAGYEEYRRTTNRWVPRPPRTA